MVRACHLCAAGSARCEPLTRRRMKITFSSSVLFAAILIAKGQGTFVYDQQSATNGIATFGASISQGEPIGQAFTPSLSGVGFVQLQLLNSFNLTNATIAVNLWADSLGGTFLASTERLSLPAGYGMRTTTFRFGSPVTLTPGSTYYERVMNGSVRSNDTKSAGREVVVMSRSSRAAV